MSPCNPGETGGPSLILSLEEQRSTAPAVVKDFLEWLWSFSRCRVCGGLGPCAHREPDVDIARCDAWYRTLRQKGVLRAE